MKKIIMYIVDNIIFAYILIGVLMFLGLHYGFLYTDYKCPICSSATQDNIFVSSTWVFNLEHIHDKFN